MTGQLDAPRLVSADDVCQAAETTLKEHLPALLATLGITDPKRSIQTWQQLPTPEALVAAQLPGVAITSPGLTDAPRRDGDGRWRATWRLAIGFYDRGRDHTETQGRTRDGCAWIRAVLLANPSLGGLVEDLTWVGEEYRLVPQRDSARTFAGGAVAVDVTVPNVVDMATAADPVVRSLHPTLAQRAPRF